MRYRKKPVEVEAYQLTQENFQDWESWPRWLSGAVVGSRPRRIYYASPPALIVVDTLEGQMKAYPDDWIIKGVQGELYPCRPAIFEATYEEVGDEVSEEAD